MCSFYAGDAAAPALRTSSLTQSHDQLSVTAEGTRGDHNVVWHHSQTNKNGSFIDGISKCNSIMRTHNQVTWHSSSCMTVTQRPLEETIEEDKAVSAWPVHSAYSTANSSKPETEPINNPNEKAQKAETAASCRLFGVDLISHSVSPQPLEPVNVSAISNEGSVIDSHMKPELLKLTKDTNQGKSKAWEKENCNKQNSTSSRSRTKVHT